MNLFKGKIDKPAFTTGLIRKVTIDLSTVFTDKKITIAGWQTVLATTDFAIAQHLTFKIHDLHNASIPLLPFCAIEDKWIKEIYLSNDEVQPGVSVDFLVANPPTKLNYAGISLPSAGGGGNGDFRINTTLNTITSSIDDGDIIFTYAPGIAVKLQSITCEFPSATTHIRLELYGLFNTFIYAIPAPDVAAGGHVTWGLGLPYNTINDYTTAPLPDLWYEALAAHCVKIHFTGAAAGMSILSYHY